MTSINKQLDLHVQGNLQATDSQGLYTNPQTKGVTVAWLAQAFGMSENSVRFKLRDCPVKTNRARGTKMQVRLYDIAMAAKFLVAPAYSTKTYMRSLKRGDLPPVLQQAVWDALLKRQKWEENAGVLWRTEAIREVLGGTFQTLKFTMQLWTETIERQVSLSDEQRQLIRDLVDALQVDLYAALVKRMQESDREDTGSGPQLSELEAMFGETELVSAMLQDDDEDEEAGIEALV